MRRREFITLLGGAAAAWPLAARAQEQTRRVGVLAPGSNSDADQLSRLKVFQDALRELGWTDGRNIQIELRLAAGSVELFRTYAAELVGLKPDVLLADSSPSTGALQRETRTVPIVFARVSDPFSQGFVSNMARPGGNITGFTNYEPAMGGKWVELLKEAVPSIRRIALVYNPQTAPYTATFLPAFETAARAHAVTLVNAPVHDVRRTRGGHSGASDRARRWHYFADGHIPCGPSGSHLGVGNSPPLAHDRSCQSFHRERLLDLVRGARSINVSGSSDLRRSHL